MPCKPHKILIEDCGYENKPACWQAGMQARRGCGLKLIFVLNFCFFLFKQKEKVDTAKI
tara:strand:- start:4109 stop:4285 length:177 start_codon:yes stop_codon:yes gene_type:complete